LGLRQPLLRRRHGPTRPGHHLPDSPALRQDVRGERSRDRPRLAGLFIYAAVSVLYALADSLWALGLFRFIQGIASVMVTPIAQAYVGGLTAKGHERRTLNAFCPLYAVVAFSVDEASVAFVLLPYMFAEGLLRVPLSSRVDRSSRIRQISVGCTHNRRVTVDRCTRLACSSSAFTPSREGSRPESATMSCSCRPCHPNPQPSGSRSSRSDCGATRASRGCCRASRTEARRRSDPPSRFQRPSAGPVSTCSLPWHTRLRSRAASR